MVQIPLISNLSWLPGHICYFKHFLIEIWERKLYTGEINMSIFCKRYILIDFFSWNIFGLFMHLILVQFWIAW